MPAKGEAMSNLNTTVAAVAAIQFALETDDGLTFLRLWNKGEFARTRSEWPEAPEAVYIGAGPLQPDMTAPAEAACGPDQDTILLDFTEQPGVMIDGATDADGGEPGWFVNGKTYPSGMSLRECLADAMRAKTAQAFCR
jgi:hypothetical protein